MKRFINLFLALAILAGMLVLSPVRSARAATLTVTNTNDSGPNSLRQALLDANIGDIIDATGISGTITLASTLNVNESLTINGPGTGNLTISGNNAVRVLYINSGLTVTIRDLTIANGKVVDADGAGINNLGTLTLENVIITGNHAVKSASNYLRGGGVHNNDNASLTIKNSIISNNSAVQNGGGIHVGFNGFLSLTNVEISGNSLSYYGSSGGGISIRQGTTATLDKVSITDNTAIDDGAGLYTDSSITMTNSLVAGNIIGTNAEDRDSDGGGLNFGGIGATYDLSNVTVSGNTAVNLMNDAGGAGISAVVGTLNLNNVTITGNSAEGYGGGLFISGAATVNIGNSILGGNTTATSLNKDCSGTINSLGYNLVKDTTGCTINGSLLGVLTNLDPMLVALVDNGGPTKTHALSLNSPALDAADTLTSEPTDQRGFARPQGTVSDMGAYELRKGKVIYRSNGAQDGWVLENSESGNAGGSKDSTATTLRLGDDTAKKQYRSLLSFATGALPDTAVITKVTLKVRKQGITGGGNPVTAFQGFLADVRKGTFGSAALQVTDWQAVGNKTVGPSTPALLSGWYALDLSSAKLQINKLTTSGGLTQIRLRFQLDDNNNATANFLSLYSGNAPLASRPQLIVEYYVP